MKTKFKFEFQITILALIIAGAVALSGYYAYTNIAGIVSSMEKLAQPDQKLYLLKDISSDLIVVENSARMFVLTNKRQHLAPFDSLSNHLPEKLQNLYDLSEPETESRMLIDSMSSFSAQKLTIWQEIIRLHQTSRKTEPVFAEVYSKLDEPKIDTVAVSYEVEVEPKGFLKKLFGKKQTKTETDTTYIQHEVASKEIKENLSNLESELERKDKRLNALESELVAQNLVVGEKINRLIAEAERLENTKWLNKTREADRLAAKTYRLLLALWIASAILLLAVLLLIFNFLRKTRTYQSALRKAKNEAETLARVKEQFAANVSHEMRTPVNAIYGLSEQLMLRRHDPETSEQLTVLSKSASHLKRIVNDTLDFSKIQANRLTLHPDHFYPEEIFEEVLATQKYEAKQKGIALVFDNQLPQGLVLVGDPLRLKQILINLLGNALKFTHRGTITIEAKSEESDVGILLHFVVTDTGIGISPENLPVIFDEFVQIENADGKKYRGTGLGLSIVKKLVELQEGKIAVKSEVNSGTQISVQIPYLSGDPDKVERKQTALISIPEPMKRLAVLIADDEEFNRYLLEAILKKWGISFSQATDGHQAVEMARQKHFDVILMDLRMPGLNGFEAARAILHDNPGAFIYAISASNKEVDRRQCLNAGMRGFLSKPFSEKNLFDTLMEVLNTRPANLPEAENEEIDLKKLEHIFGDDQTFMREMIALFIKSTEKGFADIKTARETGNWEMVAEAAHKMAAPSKHLQFNTLYGYLKEIEKLAQVPGDRAQLIELLNRTEAYVSNLNARLKHYL